MLTDQTYPGGRYPFGFDVVLCDPAPARLAMALERGAHETPGRVNGVILEAGARLPFKDQAFDLVVLEEGLPSSTSQARLAGTELRRVARGERVLVADNRLAYKRSLGVHLSQLDARLAAPVHQSRQDAVSSLRPNTLACTPGGATARLAT